METKITIPRIFIIILSALGMDCCLYIKSNRCSILRIRSASLNIESLLNARDSPLLTSIRSARENTDTVSLRSHETVLPRINNIPYDLDYFNYCWCLTKQSQNMMQDPNNLSSSRCHRNYDLSVEHGVSVCLCNCEEYV